MTQILIVLWLFLTILLLSFVAKKILKREESLQFQAGKKPDIPYVTVKSGDVTLNMIVDTGCGASIIDKDVLNIVSYEESNKSVSLSALTQDSLNSGVVIIPITIRGKQIKQEFAQYESNDIANFRALYGVTIHGILGSDFMGATGCRIDYSKHALIIP